VKSAVAPHGALESAAVLLAQAAGSQRPLTLPAGTRTLWAWIGTPGEPAIEDLRSAVGRSPDYVRAVIGPTRRGIEGFRAIHQAALTVHLLLGNPASGPFGSYRELEVTALAADDPRSPRTAPPRPDCETRCVSTLRRPTTRRARPQSPDSPATTTKPDLVLERGAPRVRFRTNVVRRRATHWRPQPRPTRRPGRPRAAPPNAPAPPHAQPTNRRPTAPRHAPHFVELCTSHHVLRQRPESTHTSPLTGYTKDRGERRTSSTRCCSNVCR
jgi:hypothetical protein